jgi:hypothetical protein
LEIAGTIMAEVVEDVVDAKFDKGRLWDDDGCWGEDLLRAVAITGTLHLHSTGYRH